MAVPPIYALPTDNVAASVNPSLATGTADSNYPVTNVKNLNPASPFLTSSTGTAVDVLWDFGSAQRVDGVSLHGHNIPAGTNVRVQMNATNSWGSPTVDAGIVIATHPEDGLPVSAWVNLILVAGYSASGFRYLRVHVPSLGQKVGIGEVGIWSRLRSDISNVRYPVLFDEAHPNRVFRTAMNVKKAYWPGVRVRQQPVSFRLRSADHTAILSLLRSCRGQNKPFLWVRDTTINDACFASFQEDGHEDALIYANVIDLDMVIEELSCGQALPT